MPVFRLEEFLDELGKLPKGRILGFDVGTKTIGLALSDEGRMIASPLQTLKRTKFKQDIKTLEDLVTQHQITGFVLGLPLNMNGTEGPRVQGTRQFAKNLLDYLNLPLLFWDERLSTVAVTRTLIEADVSRKKRAEVVDKMAASYILQGVLDAVKYHSAP